MTTLTKSSKFLEYMKLHLISLNQDLEDARNNVSLPDYEYFASDAFYMGAIDATRHLLSVATDIMNNDLQGKELQNDNDY